MLRCFAFLTLTKSEKRKRSTCRSYTRNPRQQPHSLIADETFAATLGASPAFKGYWRYGAICVPQVLPNQRILIMVKNLTCSETICVKLISRWQSPNGEGRFQNYFPNIHVYVHRPSWTVKKIKILNINRNYLTQKNTFLLCGVSETTWPIEFNLSKMSV